MKRIALALLLAAACIAPAAAAPVAAPCVEASPGSPTCNPVNSGNPLPVTTTATAPAAGTAGAGYPPGATPVVASATGTTAGATATLPAAAGKFTYICGFSVAPGSATTAITINITVTGPSSTFTESVGAPATAVGVTGAVVTNPFTPCVPASAVNTAIAVAAGALGTAGVNQDVNAWGYQQ